MSPSSAPDSPEATPPATEETISHPSNTSAVRRNWGVIQIVALYVILSGLWVIFSDQVVVLLVPDPATLLTVNTLKGWGFILVTALLLYGLIRRYTARLLDTRIQSATAVQSAEEKYRDIVENAIEGIFQTTPDGRYVTANPALARIYGYDSPPI
jgi:PAS domain-containing protein